jgi:hypothetical protein
MITRLRSLRRPFAFRAMQIATAILCLFVMQRLARRVDAHPATWNDNYAAEGSLASMVELAPEYRGVLTFATTGNGDPFHPAMVQDLDLTSGQMSVRFNGLDATRASNGEIAFLSRMSGGFYATHGVVVADARGVPGQPLFICKEFNSTDNRSCSAPKLSPNGALVAFATRGSGTYCKGNYDMYWGDFIVVVDRRGNQIASFEGYADAAWQPNGRLLLMGSACRSGGVWLADPALRALSRVDNGQVSTPASAPIVRPDGQAVAFVWNNQLWLLTLGARVELSQLTNLAKPVNAAAWSPDGTALATIMFDVSMPVRSLVLFRPGDEKSAVVRQLSVYPYGPVSWR